MLVILVRFCSCLDLIFCCFFLSLWEKKKDILSPLLFQVFPSAAFCTLGMHCALKSEEIVSRAGGGVRDDFYFLHYSILYFLKLFHGTYVQIFIVRKKKQWNELHFGKEKYLNECLTLGLASSPPSNLLFHVCLHHQLWLQWLAELETDSSPRDCGSETLVSRCLQSCKSWVTSVEFPKARCLLRIVPDGRKCREIALTTLWNPARLV